MTFTDFVLVVRRGVVLIIAITVAGLGVGLAASLVQTKLYTASTELFVSVRSADSSTSSDVAQGSTAAQLKVRTYVQVATSSRVLAPVIADLHLSTTPQLLARSVTATAGQDTTLLTISATDADPAQAARIANAAGKSLTALVAGKLEKSPTGPSLVNLETIQTATVPTGPSSPRLALNAALGGLVGALLGFGAASARHLLDNKVRGRDDVRAVADLAVLGTSTFDAKAKRRPLIVHSDPRDPRAEAYRSLRTNLHFIDFTAKSATITITSSLPAEGKTTVAANLAIALAETGAKTVVVDGDLRRPRLAERLGLDGTVGLTDVLIGQLELDEVLQPWGDQSLMVLPSGSVPPNPSELLGSAAMEALIRHLSTSFDYVILDAPPLLPVTDAAVLSRLTDGALLVVASGRTRKVDLDSSVDKLQRIGSRVLGAVLTMVPAGSESTYASMYYRDEPASVTKPRSARRFSRGLTR